MESDISYLIAIKKMGDSLPIELVNIILQYIVGYNLQILSSKLNVKYLSLENFLVNTKGVIIGKCLLYCLMNVPTNILTIIIPVKSVKETEDLSNKFVKGMDFNGVNKRCSYSYNEWYNYRRTLVTPEGKIILKYSLIDNFINECYGISGDKVTFDGKEFNFLTTNLGELILQKPITVEPYVRSFSAVNDRIRGYVIGKSTKSLNFFTDNVDLLHKICLSYNDEDRAVIQDLIHQCTTAECPLLNYLYKIIKYMIYGYRITNVQDLKKLVCK